MLRIIAVVVALLVLVGASVTLPVIEDAPIAAVVLVLAVTAVASIRAGPLRRAQEPHRHLENHGTPTDPHVRRLARTSGRHLDVRPADLLSTPT